MKTYERRVETTATPETVWRIWSDVSTWTEWNPDVKAISLDGTFADGTTGTMTTGAGTHAITLAEVRPGKSFRLDTMPIPMTTFAFRCVVAPREHGGSWVSQSVTMHGVLAAVFGPMMGNRVAEGFVPLLKGLAAQAEKAEKAEQGR